MLSEERLKEILTLAVQAPSGDNAQPWEFEISKGSISVFNVPGQDPTLYNFREHGSFLAHGAVVENIAIIASHFGYRAEIRLFPGERNCTAHIKLVESSPINDPLFSVIKKRVTNRKPYKVIALKSGDRAKIEKSLLNIESTSLLIVEDRKKIEQLARALSINERLLMENKHLHDFLFGMIRWTREMEARKPGLYIETMELPPPVRFLFRHVLYSWPLVRALNIIGFSRMLPKQTATLYGSCSAIGGIAIKNLDNTSFLNAGRALQRIWLTITHAGLSLQPVGAIPYLARRIHAGEGQVFSKKHTDLIRKEHVNIAKAFDLSSDEHIAMIFRVGYDDAPSAYSLKLPPVIRQDLKNL